jgi:hypothetical protein
MSPRRMLGRASAAALVAVALLTASVAPAAASNTYTYSGGSVIYARVHGSHGYRVNFSETGKRYFAVRASGHGTSTVFGLHGGPVTGDRMSADLGKRGSAHLRFVAVGKPRPVPVPRWCTGRPGAWQSGYLVGGLHFRAERGFTEVSLRKVPASREVWSGGRCRYLSSIAYGKRLRQRRARLNVRPAKSDRHAPVEYFGATVYHRHARPAGRRAVFRVERREGSGRISITREAKVEAPESTFRFPGGPKLPEEVEVKPPAPFSGSASFVRTPESTFEWVGDLSVDLPGIDPVRLAGPAFSASVCALGGCVRQESEGSLF